MKLEVEKVTKRFTVKGTPAVFDASFVAAEGGITTLLGPSGSGKTTLLRLVAGLERADEGRILFDGKDISRLPVHERGLGFVFQGFALFPHMTVRRNISFPLEVKGVEPKTRDERVDELLSLVQLEGYGERYPRQLSGGQRQRVGFARALASRPPVLLLDEPFGALDTQVRVELRRWVAELHTKANLTSVMVTHDQEEALELSQRIVVLDRGKVVQVGTPREVYDAPKSSFVASFVGSANVLSGTVDGNKATLVVRPHEVRLARKGRGSVGTVIRIVSLGASVKLQVTLPSNQQVTVQIPRGEADTLALKVGDRVAVELGTPKVFFEDYAI